MNMFRFSKNELYKPQYEYYSYLWYRYNKLFFGSLIKKGKKLWALKFFHNIKFEIKIRENTESYWVFLTSILNITPDLMLFPRKQGGTVYWVPLSITERKQYSFAVKWVIKLLRDRNGGRLKKQLVVDTLVDAIYDKGVSYEKKISVYKEGVSNKHLLRYFK